MDLLDYYKQYPFQLCVQMDEILNMKVIEMLDILAIILGLSEVSFVVWLVVKNLYIKGDR